MHNNTRIYTAPDNAWIGKQGFRVFLAGAIDMGKAVNWQQYVTDELYNIHDLVILNPRREEDFTPDMEKEQIKWELIALHTAHVIFLWLPKDALAPISLLELGLFVRWRLPYLIPGVEPGFYRRRNVLMTCLYHGVRVYDNLDAMVAEVKALCLAGTLTGAPN